MKKYILAFVLTLNLVSFFNSCKCPDERYLDYEGIEAKVSETTISKDKYLEIDISKTGVYYLAATKPQWNWGNTIYATSICEPGYAGEKFSIVKISVSSSADFDKDHLAGENLDDLLLVYGSNKEGKTVLGFLKDFTIDEVNAWFIYIKERPELDKTHVFTIEFEKSNGEILSCVSKEITWE